MTANFTYVFHPCIGNCICVLPLSLDYQNTIKGVLTTKDDTLWLSAMQNFLQVIVRYTRNKLLKYTKPTTTTTTTRKPCRTTGMEVTRTNFKQACTILEKELPRADFIAIDGEFTGLSSIREKAPGYDTLEEKYHKTCKGTGKMLLIQYGISFFSWQEETNNYKATPFTFYIFPRAYRRWGNDVVFTCQSSSLDFLKRNGFDFNKLFRGGISFMRKDTELYERGKIEERMAEVVDVKRGGDGTKPPGEEDSDAETKVCVPEKQREFVDDVCRSVCDFMKDRKQTVMDLAPCDYYQRQLLYDVMAEKYPLGLYLECVTTTEGDRDIKLIRCHKTSQRCINTTDLKRREEELALEEALGFSKIVHLLAKSKKPIIGHNMFLDLFLTWSNFYGPPPDTLRDFKQSMLDLFPVIYDTKFISTLPPVCQVLYSTGLGSIVNSIENETLPIPNVYISDDLGSDYEYTEQYHQAGYDSYCTGRVFLSVCQYVLSSRGKQCERIDFNDLEEYKNCVFVMGLRDTMFTDFSKDEDPCPDRKNVFHVEFPRDWRKTHLEVLFSPYSSIRHPINWINDTSAFVTVTDEDSLDNIYKNLVCNCEADCTVTRYDDFMSPQTANGTYEPAAEKTEETVDNVVTDKNTEGLKSRKRAREEPTEDGEISD